MTRADFIEGRIFILMIELHRHNFIPALDLDRLNIISIDINHNVRPDSFLLLHAARDVVEEEGFEEKLQSVRDRIDEIESLHRTRELTVSTRSRPFFAVILNIPQFKDVDKGDRIRLTVDKGGARLVEDS